MAFALNQRSKRFLVFRSGIFIYVITSIDYIFLVFISERATTDLTEKIGTVAGRGEGRGETSICLASTLPVKIGMHARVRADESQ